MADDVCGACGGDVFRLEDLPAFGCFDAACRTVTSALTGALLYRATEESHERAAKMAEINREGRDLTEDEFIYFYGQAAASEFFRARD